MRDPFCNCSFLLRKGRNTARVSRRSRHARSRSCFKKAGNPRFLAAGVNLSRAQTIREPAHQDIFSLGIGEEGGNGLGPSQRKYLFSPFCPPISERLGTGERRLWASFFIFYFLFLFFCCTFVRWAFQHEIFVRRLSRDQCAMQPP